MVVEYPHIITAIARIQDSGFKTRESGEIGKWPPRRRNLRFEI